MVALVNGAVPAEEFALAETFAAHPSLSVRVGNVGVTGRDRVMPLLWTRNVPPSDLVDAFEADPTVDNVELVAQHDAEGLYRMEWVENVQIMLQMITNSEATVLDAIGVDGEWRFRVLYPDRSLFSKTSEFCDARGLTFDVVSITDVDRSSAGRYGLTREQRAALVEATKRGYFSVPRESTLSEVADDLGLSHQALSERIRRSTEALVENTLVFEGEAESGSEPPAPDRARTGDERRGT